MAPVTEENSKEAVIVAHGSPGDPVPQDEAMAALAAAVASRRPGWRVRGATLASPHSLEGAVQGLTRPMIYPFFMAEGYFTGEVLPRRLKQLPVPCRQLPAFGSDEDLPRLIGDAALAGAAAAGLQPATSTLLLAAHGSQVSPASRIATLRLAERLSGKLPFRAIVPGFIEEAPFLTDTARGLGGALCLPLFTLSAGHVLGDVPEALAEADFVGPLLPHIGAHPDVPAMIAAALQQHATAAMA
jgi:sirohydrochlorin ferrochelatase